MFETDQIMQQLRELHSPQEHYAELFCEGCSTGFEGEEPEWPCRTAELVYTAAEITEYAEAARWLRKWDRQMRFRNVAVSNRPWSMLDVIYGRMMDSFIADKVFPKVSVDRTGITYEYSKNEPLIQVSTQLLEDT